MADIIGVIAGDDAEAAARFGTALLDHVDLLERFPQMGSAIRAGSPVRKLIHSPIVVYYQIHNNKRLVEVLHFRHGSRRRPILWAQMGRRQRNGYELVGPGFGVYKLADVH